MGDIRVMRDDLKPPPPTERRHLLSVADLSRDDIERLLATARNFSRTLEHPLALHPEDVDDVGGADRRDVGGGVAAHRLHAARKKRRWPDQRRPCADEVERLDQRARDPRMEDVADDRNVQALEPAELLAEGVEVEERLRRMLVLSIARVHDVR